MWECGRIDGLVLPIYGPQARAPVVAALVILVQLEMKVEIDNYPASILIPPSIPGPCQEVELKIDNHYEGEQSHIRVS